MGIRLTPIKPYIWPALAGIALGAALLGWQQGSPLSTNPALAATLPSPPSSYADAVERAAPAVVNIYTRTYQRQPNHPLLQDPFFRRFFNIPDLPNRERMESSLGSGVIFDRRGYVVTNHHVIQHADEITVALRDGREAPARLVGSDPDTDLAVLAIDLPNLPQIDVFNGENARIGDIVFAIGNPFGVGQTVTMGIISALGRSQLGLSTYEHFIQTDAAINPGNSGGALIDAQGQLLGINTAIFSRSGGSQGIGFAIPAAMVTQIVQDLIEHGEVIRGWLGVETREVQGLKTESGEGLLITGIYRNGPAHQAGLLPGDIITHLNGKAVMGNNYSLYEVARTPPTTLMKLRILRESQPLELQLRVGRRPARGT